MYLKPTPRGERSCARRPRTRHRPSTLTRGFQRARCQLRYGPCPLPGLQPKPNYCRNQNTLRLKLREASKVAGSGSWLPRPACGHSRGLRHWPVPTCDRAARPGACPRVISCGATAANLDRDVRGSEDQRTFPHRLRRALCRTDRLTQVWNRVSLGERAVFKVQKEGCLLFSGPMLW